MSLVFGSTACHHWFPDSRKPKDLDIISEEPLMSPERQHYWVPSFKNILERNKDSKFVDPEFLYTIKASHLGWNIFWDKTLFDVIFFQKKNLKLDRELYKNLVKDFTEVHGKRWASLEGKDSKNFFEDAVERVYNHDSVHESVCYYDRPLYEKILKKPGDVGCSKEKFELLPHEDKIRMVKEEIFVTALERYLVPNDFNYLVKRAYFNSLKKLATTMSSGWFKLFVIEHISELIHNEDDFVSKFKKGLKNKTVKYEKRSN